MLGEFVLTNHAEILARARLRASARAAPLATESELSIGLPMFLDQLQEALRRAAAKEGNDQAAIDRSGIEHGEELFRKGLTIGQVVHNYGDLCQVITGLALERRFAFEPSEFRTLNLCLDDAIASAVTEFARLGQRAVVNESTERLGFLAHELRNVVNALTLSFELMKGGSVTPTGSTGQIHGRNLGRLSSLIDRSLAEVRLDAGIQNVEQIALRDVLEEMEITGAMMARARGIRFAVDTVDSTVVVRGDRQVFTATIANLLQNAFKFSRPEGTVSLRATTTTTRVLIEVEDECGGLPPGKPDDLFRAFAQQSADRSGLGLGLSICVKAVHAMDGQLRVRDLPGKGCVFTIDVPKHSPPPTPIRGRVRTPIAPSGTTSEREGAGRQAASR